MKRKLSFFLMVALVFGLCTFFVQPSLALDAAEDAVLNGLVKITLDGERIIPVDVDGSPMLPITYNGSTYLPLRAMVQLFGVTVAWDGDSSTVYMKSETDRKVPEFKGEISAKQTPAEGTVFMPWVTLILDGVEIIPIGEDARPVSPLLYSERIYLPLRAMASFLDVAVAWDSTTDTVVLTTIDRRGPAGPAGPAGSRGAKGADGGSNIKTYRADLSDPESAPLELPVGDIFIFRINYNNKKYSISFGPPTEVGSVIVDCKLITIDDKVTERLTMGGQISIRGVDAVRTGVKTNISMVSVIISLRYRNPKDEKLWSTYEINALLHPEGLRATILGY